MAKLTDTQLVILSAASQRTGGNLLPLPKSLKLNKAAASMVLQSLLKSKLAAEQPAGSGTAVWREDGDVKLMLTITEDALKRLDGPAAAPQEPAQAPPKKAKKPTVTLKPVKTSPSAKKEIAPTPSSKIGSLISLLGRKTGATISEAMEATGWQAHSVRGAISGSLKKKQGLTVTSSVEGTRGRVYRIAVGH